MKSRILMCVSAITLFAALAIPVQLAAQHIASGTNGQITFTQGVLDFNGGAPANVFVANPDGSNVQQVVSAPVMPPACSAGTRTACHLARCRSEGGLAHPGRS